MQCLICEDSNKTLLVLRSRSLSTCNLRLTSHCLDYHTFSWITVTACNYHIACYASFAAFLAKTDKSEILVLIVPLLSGGLGLLPRTVWKEWLFPIVAMQLSPKLYYWLLIIWCRSGGGPCYHQCRNELVCCFHLPLQLSTHLGRNGDCAMITFWAILRICGGMVCWRLQQWLKLSLS